MNSAKRELVFLGLSITSAWGNGHATTYRGLIKELARLGHKVTFLERDVPWYAENRELDHLPYCAIAFYSSLAELKERFSSLIRSADAVVVGSYVPDGIEIGRWVAATGRNAAVFYDIDTPVTLAGLAAGKCQYISPDLYPAYHLYLSFTGGPTLSYIEHTLRSPCARPLYCSVDPSLYYPDPQPTRWDLAYLGTYALDRQPAVETLLIQTARANPRLKFAVAGPQYPETIVWPLNVERTNHVPASQHRGFYNGQRFTLNLTRRDMVRAGYSPSVRLFEAAACGIPIISDEWPGLSAFFAPSSEIFLAGSSQDCTSHLQMSEERRLEAAARALARTLRFHTAAVRAREFETYVTATLEMLAKSNKRSNIVPVKSTNLALT